MFNVGDRVIINRKTMPHANSDKGKIGIISAVFHDGALQYEVDFGQKFTFTHTGENHPDPHYRYYASGDLDLYILDEDKIDDISVDEITILLNN